MERERAEARHNDRRVQASTVTMPTIASIAAESPLRSIRGKATSRAMPLVYSRQAVS
jgi:hypothetical protein